MQVYSDFDQVWLVKAGGRVMGPFSMIELVSGLNERRFSVIDEVRNPVQRWIFFRENAQLSEVVKAIREQEQDAGSLTGVTQTNVTITSTAELTKSITGDSKDELTPVPSKENLAKTDASLIRGSERRISSKEPATPHTPSYGAMYDPNVTGQIQKKRSGFARALWSITILAVIGFSGYTLMTTLNKSTPNKPVGSEDLIKMARQQKNLGFYAKSLALYNKAAAIQPLDSSSRYQMIPLYLASEAVPSEVKKMVQEFSKENVPDQNLQADFANWRGLLAMKDGNFAKADTEFKKTLSIDPLHKKALLNRMLNSVLNKNYEEAFKLALDMQSLGINHPVSIFSKVIAILTFKKEKVDIEKANTTLAEMVRLANTKKEFRIETLLLTAALQEKMGKKTDSLSTIGILLSEYPDSSKEFINDLEVDFQILSWDRLGMICDYLVKAHQNTFHAKGLSSFCSYEKGELVSAIKEITESRTQFQNETNLIGLHAFLMYKSGRTPEAKAIAFQASADRSRLAQIIRGQICLDEKDLNCAETGFNKALDLESTDSRATLGLVKVNLARNKKDKALQEITKGISAAPTYRPLIEIREEINEK